MPDPEATASRRASDETETLPGAPPSPSSRSGQVQAVFEPGQVVAGRFRISRLIRQGGMGQVYEAEDLELGQRVALKTLRPELAADHRLIARFKEEISLSRRVTHSNVCRAFDLFRHEGEPGGSVLFISMEYLPGRPLDRILAERGALPARHALSIARQVAEGLEAAHRAGVLHRDLKPGNVLLVPAPDGLRAVVTDFGLAEASAPGSPDGPLAGTPSHMAPEQLDGRGATPRTDVYALGLLLFEMRTGRLPEPGELDRAATRRRLGRTWAAVVRRCLAPEPEERPVSPRAAVAQLEPGRAERRWRRLAPWAAVLALTLAGGVALYTGLAPKPERPEPPPIEALTARPSAAVLVFTSEGSEETWLREALPQMLQAHLATGPSIRLVPERYLAKLGVGSSEDPSTLARTVGVRWLVTGSYAVRDTPRGSLLEVDVRLVDTETGRIEERFTDTQPEEELFDLVARIAARLRSNLRVEQLSPVELTLLEGSLPEELGAFRLYSEGLLALDRHRPDQARTFLVQAVEAAPGYPLARVALADALDSLGRSREAARQGEEAFRLAQERLPREEVLRIEARYRELSQDWDEAIRVWRALRTVFPDRPEYGFGLAHAETLAGRPADALETLEALVASDAVSAEDPRLHLAKAVAHKLLGDYPAALRSAAAAERRAAEEGLPALTLEASLERAYVLQESGSLDEAEARYREALGTLEDWDDPGRIAEVTYHLGIVASYRSDFAEARRLYERALATFRELGDLAGEAGVLKSLGLTLAELGDLAEADRRGGEAVSILRRLGHKRELEAAIVDQAGIAAERGDLERAETLYAEAISLIRETESKVGLAATLNNLAALHLARGDTGAARRAVAEALGLSRRAESDMGVVITSITLSSVDWDELQLDAARRRLEEVQSLAAEAGFEWLLGHIDEGLGKVALEAGDLKEARRRLEASLERRRKIGEDLELSASHCALAEVALAEGSAREAETSARRCLAGSRERGKRPEVPEAGALLVEALVRMGRLEEAEQVAATTVQPVKDSPFLLVRVAAVRVRALLAAARGERERAIQELSALLETGDLADGPPRLQRRTRLLLEQLSEAGQA